MALQLLQRLTGLENVGIDAEWLKLQPWRSDAEGEHWEETLLIGKVASTVDVAPFSTSPRRRPPRRHPTSAAARVCVRV